MMRYQIIGIITELTIDDKTDKRILLESEGIYYLERIKTAYYEYKIEIREGPTIIKSIPKGVLIPLDKEY